MKPGFNRKCIALLSLACVATLALSQDSALADTPPASIELGPRPFWLAETLPDGELRDSLMSCDTSNIASSPFSIGHRGAPMQFPEHTRESYIAAARMGAGILECDVSFTRDKALVCRHSQCDLHTTTNILETELASQCAVPPNFDSDTPFAEVQCCTSDLALAEFKTLEGKMDAGNSEAATVEEYIASTSPWRTDGYASRGNLMTHAESVALFDALGTDMTPELKKVVREDIDFPRTEQADQMLAEYREAGIDPSRVWPQSFEEEDIQHWLATAPDFAEQVVYLDDRYNDDGFDPMAPDSWVPDMQTLYADGVRWLAPPTWVLVTAEDGQMVPSAYAEAVIDAGLGLITWTLERSGPLTPESPGGWYYQSVAELIDDESDVLQLLDVLAKDVGVTGVFSDWPATTSFYAHCRL